MRPRMCACKGRDPKGKVGCKQALVRGERTGPCRAAGGRAAGHGTWAFRSLRGADLSSGAVLGFSVWACGWAKTVAWLQWPWFSPQHHS